MSVHDRITLTGNIVSFYALDNPIHKWGTSGQLGTAGGEVTWSFATSVLSGTAGGSAYSSDAAITDASFQQAVRQAFDVWAQVANISFREVADGSNVQIRFAMDAIDGVSNTLGFADTRFTSFDGGATWINTTSHIIFDTAEPWNATSFLSTSIHEIGHSLGIDHSSVSGSIMQAVTIGDNYGTALTQDDIDAVQALYGASGTTPPTTIPDVALGVYRFFNSATGTHFYSASHTEATSISANLPQYNYENVAFRSVNNTDVGAVEFYRFFNTETGTHFFTSSAAERDSVIANLPQFSYEGVAYHLHSSSDADDIALYRFFNSQTGTHFYTANETEKDNVINTLSQYNYEGIVGYVDIA